MVQVLTQIPDSRFVLTKIIISKCFSHGSVRTLTKEFLSLWNWKREEVEGFGILGRGSECLSRA